MHQRGSKREGCTGLPIRRHARKAAATDLEATRASGERGAVAQIERPAISRPPGVTPHPVCLGLRASHASGPPAQAILKSALRLAQLVERVRPVGQGSGPIDDMRSIAHYKRSRRTVARKSRGRRTCSAAEGALKKWATVPCPGGANDCANMSRSLSSGHKQPTICANRCKPRCSSRGCLRQKQRGPSRNARLVTSRRLSSRSPKCSRPSHSCHGSKQVFRSCPCEFASSPTCWSPPCEK
jgi:hypothetical protein